MAQQAALQSTREISLGTLLITYNGALNTQHCKSLAKRTLGRLLSIARAAESPHGLSF